MFDNAGSKLKSIAKVLWYISIIASILFWICFTVAYGIGGFFIGILFCAVMFLVEYFYCAIVYTVGDIAENSSNVKFACDYIIQQNKNNDNVLSKTLDAVKRIEEQCEELKKIIDSKETTSSEQEGKIELPKKLEMADIVEKLRQYKELLKLGVISEERYEFLKQELLSSIEV